MYCQRARAGARAGGKVPLPDGGEVPGRSDGALREWGLDFGERKQERNINISYTFFVNPNIFAEF